MFRREETIWRTNTRCVTARGLEKDVTETTDLEGGEHVPALRPAGDVALEARPVEPEAAEVEDVVWVLDLVHAQVGDRLADRGEEDVVLLGEARHALLRYRISLIGVRDLKLSLFLYLHGLAECDGVVSGEVLHVIPLDDLRVLPHQRPDLLHVEDELGEAAVDEVLHVRLLLALS